MFPCTTILAHYCTSRRPIGQNVRRVHYCTELQLNWFELLWNIMWVHGGPVIFNWICSNYNYHDHDCSRPSVHRWVNPSKIYVSYCTDTKAKEKISLIILNNSFCSDVKKYHLSTKHLLARHFIMWWLILHPNQLL